MCVDDTHASEGSASSLDVNLGLSLVCICMNVSALVLTATMMLPRCPVVWILQWNKLCSANVKHVVWSLLEYIKFIAAQISLCIHGYIDIY